MLAPMTTTADYSNNFEIDKAICNGSHDNGAPLLPFDNSTRVSLLKKNMKPLRNRFWTAASSGSSPSANNLVSKFCHGNEAKSSKATSMGSCANSGRQWKTDTKIDYSQVVFLKRKELLESLA